MPKPYIGQAKYSESITYSNKVINSGYSLEPVYGDLFMADNHTSKEFIFPIRYEGEETPNLGRNDISDLQHCTLSTCKAK